MHRLALDKLPRSTPVQTCEECILAQRKTTKAIDRQRVAEWITWDAVNYTWTQDREHWKRTVVGSNGLTMALDVRGEGEGEEEIWLTCTLAKLTHVLEPTRSQGRQGKHCSSCSRAQGVACSLRVSLSYRTWGSHTQESTRYLICWCCHCSGLQDVNVELTCHSARSINVVYWNCLDWMQVIEKRRRDRINNSLAELRRLVPAAFEKQVTVSRGQQ